MSQYASQSTQESTKLIREMLKRGYGTTAISITTRRNDKHVRNIRKMMLGEGHDVPLTRERKRISITSHAKSMQASIVMKAYVLLGGQGVETSINIMALNVAYDLYTEHMRHIPGVKMNDSWPEFSIQDAWNCANALRSNEARMATCVNSSCGCSFFIAETQKPIQTCPFCRPFRNRKAS